MSRIEKLLNTADTIWERELRDPYGLPDPHDENSPWYTCRYQKFRIIIERSGQLGFANGVFRTLSAFDMDERRKKIQFFNNGDGI